MTLGKVSPNAISEELEKIPEFLNFRFKNV
jgi:hypothetical protein